ncbi:MAG TPA: ABC transporter permease [Thermoanaerobaculia bacterium]|nr:ABC transporter permease [Thermoanaerobaculia bacterium]
MTLLASATAALCLDFRVALRGALRQPAVSLSILLTLTAGVATVVTAFSVADELLLRPLPYPHAQALHLVHSVHPEQGVNLVSRQAVYAAAADDGGVFDRVAAASRLEVALDLRQGARQVDGLEVSPEFFSLFGARTALGRLPSAQELPRAGAGVVLSAALWRAAFAGDPAVLGRSLSLRGALRHGQGTFRETLPVVGVLDEDFAPPFNRLEPDLWIVRDLTRYTFESERFLLFFGRLRPGIDRQEAARRLVEIEATVLAQTSETTDWAIQLMPLRQFLVGPLRQPVALLFVTGVLIFAIAAVNAGGLSAARLQARSADGTMRLVLGASRWRLIQFLLAEAFLLALSAGALGLAVAALALRLFEALAGHQLALTAPLALSGRTAVFALATVLAISLWLALFPALLFLRRPLAGRLASLGACGRNTGGPLRVRFLFVAAQVGSALTVAVAALLLQLSSLELAAIDPGFDPNRAVTAWIDLEEEAAAGPDGRRRLLERLLEALDSQTGLVAAGLTSDLPLSRSSGAIALGVESPRRADALRDVQMRFAQVSPGYFEAMGIERREGRLFRPGELDPSSFILSESASRRLFGVHEAIGRRLKLGGLESENPWLPVVGVVEDVHAESIRQPVEPTVYMPLLSAGRMALVVRLSSHGEAGELSRVVPTVLHRVAPTLPLAEVEPLVRLVERDTAPLRLSSWLMSVLALVAVALAATGAYGTIWSLTLARLPEMRIRRALGARRRHLLAQTLTVLGPWVIVGVVGGALGAWLLCGLLRAQLFGVALADPRMIFSVAALLAFVGAGGLLIPFSYYRRIEVAALLRA